MPEENIPQGQALDVYQWDDPVKQMCVLFALRACLTLHLLKCFLGVSDSLPVIHPGGLDGLSVVILGFSPDIEELDNTVMVGDMVHYGC